MVSRLLLPHTISPTECCLQFGVCYLRPDRMLLSINPCSLVVGHLTKYSVVSLDRFSGPPNALQEDLALLASRPPIARITCPALGGCVCAQLRLTATLAGHRTATLLPTAMLWQTKEGAAWLSTGLTTDALQSASLMCCPTAALTTMVAQVSPRISTVKHTISHGLLGWTWSYHLTMNDEGRRRS